MVKLTLRNKNVDFASDLLQGMHNLCADEELCDVVLITAVDGQRYSCHRSVLACSSPYFRAMFTSTMRESKQKEIVLHEVGGEQLKQLLEFCYTGEMNIHEYEDDSDIYKGVKMLVNTASMLLLDAAFQVCIDYLNRHLTPANCLGIWALAEQHRERKLMHEAEEYAKQNFVDVCQNEEFLEMPYCQLLKLTSCDRLHVATEETVFNNVMRWVQHDMYGRQQHMPFLLLLIRLTELSEEFLENEVRHICMEYGLTQAFSMVLSCKRNPAELQAREWQNKPRYMTENAEVLSTFLKEEKLIIEVFNPSAREWIPCGRIDGRSNHAAVVFKESLIIAGGRDTNFINLKTVFSFDMKRKTSRELCSMQKPRINFAMAVLDDMIYVVGGRNQQYLKSVERYDPDTNSWRECTRMIETRSSPGIAVLDGLLYVAGGSDAYTHHNSVESYNPKKNKWTPRARMNEERYEHALIAANGFLYAVGGFRSNAKAIERYDPQTNLWTLLCPLTSMNAKTECVLMGGCLLACGLDEKIAQYEFDQNVWTWRGCWKDKESIKLISVPKLSNFKIGELKNCITDATITDATITDATITDATTENNLLDV